MEVNMDVMPSFSSLQETSKVKHTKTLTVEKDLDSFSTSVLTDSISASVNFVTQRTIRGKLSSKKLPEPSKKLKKRLQQITDENATLAKIVEDKNLEIEDLKQSVQSLNEVLESVPIDELRSNSSIASNKIIDLNKRNRQLHVELDAKKVLISKRDVQIHKLERELKEVNAKLEKHDANTEKVNTLAELQGKFNALQQRLFETRNKNVELQEKLKLAGKCLQQEIGDSFDLNKLNAMAAQNTCNWRGRAQQIIHLQQTISELKSRIEIFESLPTAASVTKYVYPTEDLECLDDGTGAKPKSSRSMKSAMSFDRIAPSVRKSEIMHRAKVEELEKSIADLKTQLEDQKSKVLALKVRNKNLNEEMLRYKAKVHSLDDRGDFNGMNLASMNEQLHVQKYEFENRIDKLSAEVRELKQRCKTSEAREEELYSKFSNAKDMLAKRTAYIAELEEAIKKLEQDMKSICGDFLFSCRELRKEEFVAILDSLETEKNYLLEQNKALNLRLNEERSKHDGLNDQFGKQKIRNARLEGRIRDLEKELESNGKKKERLQRITDYASNLSAKSSVSSFVFENTNRAPLSTSSNEDTNQQINDLKHRLEFASEKISMLENRLSFLTNEKEQDRKAFQDTILNTKQTILDTILSYRGEMSDKKSCNAGHEDSSFKSSDTNISVVPTKRTNSASQ